jgi:hypothetical protein
MIIGISGKKGHGKDTVGDILRTALYRTRTEYGWQICKFADTLKDMVCMLIGCTRAQLEDPVFKNTELGESWVTYSVNDNNRTRDTWVVAGDERSIYNKYNVYSKNKLTPRLLLQLLGTECGRNIIHPNIWINALFSKYKQTIPFDKIFKQSDIEENSNWGFPNWIITDVRFINEVEAIKERGGIVIRVNNPNVESTDRHISETELDNYPFDYIIENGSTLSDLRIKAQELVRTINILNV